MKDNFKLGVILFIITAFAGLCLGFVNELTADAIEANRRISARDLREILPGAESVKEIADLKSDEGDKVRVIESNEAYNGSELVGYVFKVNIMGFHGEVDLFVAVSVEDMLTGIKVARHTETPGLGARIAEERFTSKFGNKAIDRGIAMVKGEVSADNEIEAITGATVSSRAVGEAVNTALAFYYRNIKGMEVDFGGADSTSGASEDAEEEVDDTSGATE
jgi:Na+-translocating ferredoxin:NAD+ oxidoreductase subunit G